MLSKYTNILVGVALFFALATPSSALTAPAAQEGSPFVTTSLTPPSVLVGGSSTGVVNLNNVPVEGLASAEFACTYNPALLEIYAITPTELFGADPISVVNGPQNGSFIFAVAGSLGNKATSDGAVFTFSAEGLQVGQPTIDCQVRASTGNQVLVTIPSTPASLDVLDDIPTPTQGTFAGQVIAGKPVTVTLTDQNGTVVGSAAANADGTFSLSLPAGTYTAVASAPGFLRAQGTVSIASGITTTLQTISLLAGDIDGNDVIDHLDALTIGINYNGNEPDAADLNSDGTINVLELEILSPNYRQNGPFSFSTGDPPPATQTPQQLTSTTAIPITPKVLEVSSGGSIREAVNMASAGDIIKVFGGEYDERIEVKKTLSFEALGEVTMRGFVIQADGVMIRGFTIINLRDTGINVKSGNNGVIEDNTFLYNGLAGLRLYNDTKGWIVRNNLFHRNNLYGAEVKGQNHLIEGNEVTHTIQHHPCVPTVNGADADGFRFHGSGHVFRQNYIHDMPDGRVGYDKTDCSIEELANLENDYDDSSHTDCFQTYGGSTSFVAGYDVLFEGNICKLPLADEWNNWASKAFQGSGDTYNLTFRNNLVVADFLALFQDGCHDIHFEHNTFIGSNSMNSQGLKYINCVGNAGVVKNNIFVGQRMSVGHLMIQNSNVEAGYNCVYIPDREPFRQPDPGDVWGVDPRLDADYHLLPGSPCIGAAEDGSDIGAFPFVVSP